MVTLNYDFPADFFGLKIVPTYWMDVVNTVESDWSDRRSFKFIADFWINGTFSGDTTSKVQPLNNLGSIYLNNFTKNLLSYDIENNLSLFITGNTFSHKFCQIRYGEEYSRKLDFNTKVGTYSIGNGRLFARFETESLTNLNEGDRAYIVKTDGINGAYSNFTTIKSIVAPGATSSYFDTDLDYIPTAINEVGYVYEGKEFYDYTNTDGRTPIFYTSTTHSFVTGDKVRLQMDDVATSIIKVISMTAGDSIDQITIGDPFTGEDMMSTSIPFTTSISNTLLLISLNINFGSVGYPTFSSYHALGSNLLHIYSRKGSGQSYNTRQVSVFTSGGGINTQYAQNLFIQPGYDLQSGQGWNPQLSDTYTVTNVVSDLAFGVSPIPPTYYNNEPGSERGSLISDDNYKFRNILIGNTFSLTNASYDDYGSTQSYSLDLQRQFVVGPTAGQYLTSYPKSTSSGLKEYDFYTSMDMGTADIYSGTMSGFYNGGSSASTAKLILTYNNNTTLSITISNVMSFGTNQGYAKLTFPTGPYNLNKLFQNSFLNFNPLISNYPIGSTVSSYTIQYFNNSLQAVTEKLKFNKNCSQYEKWQFIWLNSWGGWDYYTITNPFIETTEYDRDEFVKNSNYINHGNYPSLGNYNQRTYDYNKRGNTIFNINHQAKYKTSTRYFNLKEANWFKGFYKSPEIYAFKLEDYTQAEMIEILTYGSEYKTKLYPVKILDTEVLHFNDRSKMKRYEFTFSLANYKRWNLSIGN